MSMLNWQGWAENFFGWGPSAPVVTPPVIPDFHPAPGGGTRQRKKYIVDGKHYELSKKELERVLSAVMRKEPVKDVPRALRKPVAALKKVAEKVAERPAYEAVPAFDPIWDILQAMKEYEAAAQARAVAEAIAIEQDDEEVFQLLRMINEQ